MIRYTTLNSLVQIFVVCGMDVMYRNRKAARISFMEQISIFARIAKRKAINNILGEMKNNHATRTAAKAGLIPRKNLFSGLLRLERNSTS